MGALLYFLAVVVAFLVGNWVSETYLPCDWKFTVGALFTVFLLFVIGLVNTWADPNFLKQDKNNDDGEPKD